MATAAEYDVLEIIGRGSFGQIRKVRRKSDGLILVRKEISYARMSVKEKEQLTAEFAILSQLKHANIVQYIHREHIKSDCMLHLYMEYCGKGDLSKLIARCKNEGTLVPENVVWSILTQIILALYRCHNGVDPPKVGEPALKSSHGEKGARVLHRDLKPENIFLDKDESVKLGDFGLSKLLAPEQQLANTYVGTPFYMSPEIVSDQPYTHKSDIWSLGCIIYEMCCLSPPFNAKSQYSLCQKIKEGRYPPVPTQYSPELRRIISLCLNTNPNSRPDTAELLSLDVIRLNRRERDVVAINNTLKMREDILRRKEAQLMSKEEELRRKLEEKAALLKDEISTELRKEINAKLQREWEVKAEAVIKREVEKEVAKRLETEVSSRVEAALVARVEAEVARRLEQEVERRVKEMNPIPRSGSVNSAYSIHSRSSTSSRRNSEFGTCPASPPRTQFPEIVVPDSPDDVDMGSPPIPTPKKASPELSVYTMDPPRMPPLLDFTVPTNNARNGLMNQQKPPLPTAQQGPPFTPRRPKSTQPFKSALDGEGKGSFLSPKLGVKRNTFSTGSPCKQTGRNRQGLSRAGTTGGLNFGAAKSSGASNGNGGGALMVKTAAHNNAKSLTDLGLMRAQALKKDPVAVWDPTVDDMPSPFMTKVLLKKPAAAWDPAVDDMPSPFMTKVL
ncbi:G2-specific serine/threonine protein kinase [Rhizina undulata]